MNAAALKSDFPDWLSPMLVKELRQGLRSRLFLSAFYLTQLLMILSVAFNVAATASEDSPGSLGSFLDGLFWFLIAVPMLFVMPARGFGALHGELKSGTMELVFLTRLSAWRIAAGKFSAIMVQTLLLVCAVLPYVVLRYFLGGVDLLDDLQKLFFLFAASAALTAIMIAVSPYESKLLRVLFILAMIVGVQVLATFFLAWLTVGRITGASAGTTWQAYLAVGVFVPTFVVLALQMAASKIAPPAENHAIWKRLICLGVVVLAVGLAGLGSDWTWTYWFALVFSAPVLIDALAEPMQPVRSIYKVFWDRGPLGRMAGLLLTPGWVSAAFFAALLGMLWVGGGALLGKLSDSSALLGVVSFFAALILPAAFVRLFVPRTSYFLGIYLAIQIVFLVLTLMVGIMSGIANQPFYLWLAWSPLPSLFFNLTEQIKAEYIDLVLVFNIGALLLAVALLLVSALRPLRDICDSLKRPLPADAKA